MIDGKLLNNFRFADEVVLIAYNKREVTNMIQHFGQRSREAGLVYNMEKTKLISNRREKGILKVKKEVIEEVDSYKYLGKILSFKEGMEKQLKNILYIKTKRFR